jgi:hypothetical protein
MVAAQVLPLLWAAGLAVAAPQLDFGDSRSVSAPTRASTSGNINQNQVVTDVVFALQPEIERAVAAALAGIRGSTSSSAGFVSGFSSSSGSSSGFSSGSSSSSAAENNAKAEYNFEYKVADQEEQTFITQQEARDGDQVTGSYSYVDPNGALVTVNYEAGAMGFSATTDKQDGFAKPYSARGNSNSNRVSSVSSNSVTSSSASSAINSDALIAQVLAALQPQINSAVQTALSSSRTVARSSIVEAPRISAPAPRGGSIESTFGNGVSVNIDTPEFNIAY